MGMAVLGRLAGRERRRSVFRPGIRLDSGVCQMTDRVSVSRETPARATAPTSGCGSADHPAAETAVALDAGVSFSCFLPVDAVYKPLASRTISAEAPHLCL